MPLCAVPCLVLPYLAVFRLALSCRVLPCLISAPYLALEPGVATIGRTRRRDDALPDGEARFLSLSLSYLLVLGHVNSVSEGAHEAQGVQHASIRRASALREGTDIAHRENRLLEST